MKLNESRYDMAEGVVVETTDATGRVVDRRTEWNADVPDDGLVTPLGARGVDDPRDAEPVDEEGDDLMSTVNSIIVLTLAGEDEATDEMVALADRIVEDLYKSGFVVWPGGEHA